MVDLENTCMRTYETTVRTSVIWWPIFFGFGCVPPSDSLPQAPPHRWPVNYELTTGLVSAGLGYEKPLKYVKEICHKIEKGVVDLKNTGMLTYCSVDRRRYH